LKTPWRTRKSRHGLVGLGAGRLRDVRRVLREVLLDEGAARLLQSLARGLALVRREEAVVLLPPLGAFIPLALQLELVV